MTPVRWGLLPASGIACSITHGGPTGVDLRFAGLLKARSGATAALEHQRTRKGADRPVSAKSVITERHRASVLRHIPMLDDPSVATSECIDDRGAGVTGRADALNRAPLRVHWQSVEQNMDISLEHARTPKQTRSRQSFDRVLDAATNILAENGFSGLTLTQVSKQARVSIRSIHSRVHSKRDLVRPLQSRALQAIH